MSRAKSRNSGTSYLSRAAIISLAASVVLAAVIFIANNQPWGYIAPPALSGANISRGNVVAYTPWFETGTFRGDLMALPISAAGAVNLLTPNWRAALMLDAQHYATGRRIVTTDGAGTGIPFQFTDLTAAQQAQIGTSTLLNYVRGDRANESTTNLRPRSSVLGDIIHSNPVYVGKPAAGYIFGGYLAFANANASRAPRVYVGANDGMLHAFDAATGAEVFAYVPSTVIGNLNKLAVQPYSHQYYVDGFLTAGDAQFGLTWHSVLVGGLGAGGKGYFALDVTSAGAATEAIAAGKILWEFQMGSGGAANLGFGYSRPSIVKLNNGQWAAVVANGYLSGTGVASLYLLDIQTGAVIREIAVPDAAANGLSSPTLIDITGDGQVDVAYAGDLNGNLWKFDLTSASPASWAVAYAGQPLFQTALANGERQAITTSPEVGRHPEGGVMVYVATGRLFTDLDSASTTTQAVYGIWDNDWASGVPISISQLRTQQLRRATHASGASVRTATANAVDWMVHRGWVTPIEVAAASTAEQGERVIQDISLRDNRVSFLSLNPTVGSGENWFIELDASTGGAPSKTIIDANSDKVLNVVDNVDGNADGYITDSREDRVVGLYQSFGLASRPVIGGLGAGSNVALINHLTAILPTDKTVLNVLGLAGGHFDVDTSSLVSAFYDGTPECDDDDIPGIPLGCLPKDTLRTTDGHEHQWDDLFDLTTIDYFALPDGGGNPLFEINASTNAVTSGSSIFMLTVVNENLSPGGVLEINGSSIPVVAYRALLDRYLSGTLAAGEEFPFFKLTAPTVSEVNKGVQQLTSLKLSFDTFAILNGDLLPTKTGCVTTNTAGPNGEYRNGALLIQALDASNINPGFVLDVPTSQYVATSTAIHAPLGYATKGLFWETSIFWHWGGECYGDPLWAPLFDSCVVQGLGGCSKDEDDDKKDDDPPPPPDPGDPPPPPPPPPPVETDPGHGVTNTLVGGSNDTGRLFWRELVPEE